MTAKRSICVYNCSVWGSSNLSYLEKYINSVRAWAQGSYIQTHLNWTLSAFQICKGIQVWYEIVWFASVDASTPCNKAYRALLTASAPDKYTEIITEGAYRDGWKMTEYWFPPLSVSCLWDQAICTFIITAMIPLLFCVATRTCSVWPLLFLSAVWLTAAFWSRQQQN